jgi:uptake hydrogenase large subunit
VVELSEHLGDPTLMPSAPRMDADGYGLINASRGSLGHWVNIRHSKIVNYQVMPVDSG